MTNDSKLFPPRPRWEEKGYRPDEYSRWLKGDWRPIDELWAELGTQPLPEGETRCAQPPYDRLPIPRAAIPEGVVLSREADAFIRENAVEDVALPLYQGKMMYLNNWAAQPVEREQPGRLDLQPDFLLASKDLRHDPRAGARVVFRDIARNTDMRSFIAALVPGWYPCGNVLPILETPAIPSPGNLGLALCLSSLVLDWATRRRMSGTHLNWHIAEALAVLAPTGQFKGFARRVASLNMSDPPFSPEWIRLCPHDSSSPAIGSTPHEGLLLTIQIDALLASVFGISLDDLHHILTDCDRPCRQFDGVDSKGFWRVDKDKHPELRHTVLTLVAFHDLQEKIDAAGGDRDAGIESFFTQNDGEGWLLPETLRLTDYGLGHDDRAKEHQPVVSRLGPRFYDWQLAQSAEESWRECHLHARNLLGEEGYRQLLADIEAEKKGEPTSQAAEPEPPACGEPARERGLFD